MATETDTSHSGWNVDTLKEFIVTSLNDFKIKWETVREADDLRYQQRFDAQQKAVADALLAAEKAVNTALASADRAVVKAETAAEKRFESVNEFRAVLSNQSATLMPRTEADSQFKAIAEKIEDIKARLDRGDGGDKKHTSDTNTLLAVAAIVVSLAVGVFTLISSHSAAPTVVSPAVIPLK